MSQEFFEVDCLVTAVFHLLTNPLYSELPTFYSILGTAQAAYKYSLVRLHNDYLSLINLQNTIGRHEFLLLGMSIIRPRSRVC
jgi:hypothetical protein